MDTPKLNLKDLCALRERELNYPVHESVAESLFGKNVNVPVSASIQELVGQPSALAQDAFSALILRQSGLK